MKADVESELINDVGIKIIYNDDYADADTLFFFDVVEEDHYIIALFKDLGDVIKEIGEMRMPMLDSAVALWRSYSPEKRWQRMIYAIRDRVFGVTFFYPEDIDPEEISSPDRHREAQIAYVRNYFGDNKKIIEPNYEEIYKRGFKLN